MQGKTTAEAYEIAERAVRSQAKEIRQNPDLSEAAKNDRLLRNAKLLDRLRSRHDIKD